MKHIGDIKKDTRSRSTESFEEFFGIPAQPFGQLDLQVALIFTFHQKFPRTKASF